MTSSILFTRQPAVRSATRHLRSIRGHGSRLPTTRVRGNHLETSRLALVAVAIAALLASAPRGHAQTTAAPAAANEDLEPRRIGAAGTMTVGISGYVDRFFSSRDEFATNYTAQFDVARFLTNRIVVRGGLSGSGSVGGEDAEDRPVGTGAPALHALVGSLFYFTPQSMLSLYAGADYWTQLTQRVSPDAGSVTGTVGIEGALSSRGRVYIEGGYGVGLTKGEDDETRTRIVGRIGFRFKF